MFQDMMDRIEDETIKFLFFMRIEFSGGADMQLPYPEPPDEDDEEEPGPEGRGQFPPQDGHGELPPGGEGEPELVTVGRNAERQREAQQSVLDLTRNIQKKKDRELAALQFSGGGAATATPQPASKGAKVGRNELCPCGSGKKYKKCCGANA